MSHKDFYEYGNQRSPYIVHHWGHQWLHELYGNNRLIVWCVKNYYINPLKTKPQTLILLTSKKGTNFS